MRRSPYRPPQAVRRLQSSMAAAISFCRGPGHGIGSIKKCAAGGCLSKSLSWLHHLHQPEYQLGSLHPESATRRCCTNPTGRLLLIQPINLAASANRRPPSTERRTDAPIQPLRCHGFEPTGEGLMARASHNQRGAWSIWSDLEPPRRAEPGGKRGGSASFPTAVIQTCWTLLFDALIPRRQPATAQNPIRRCSLIT